MTTKLESGTYKITSLSEGEIPIGVTLHYPAAQFVRVGADLDDWKIVRAGMDKYHLSVGPYPSVGVLHGKVQASLEPHGMEWEIEYQERQNAYTIALAKRRDVGWTVSDESSAIELKPIIVGTSFPPFFSTKQLFLIKEYDEGEANA